MRVSNLFMASSAIALSAGLAHAGSFVFTNDADWDLGTYNSTNSGPPGADDQLQLDPNVVTQFDFIWVAASGRDSAVLIDTDHVDVDGVSSLADSAAGTGAVLGEYYTTPDVSFGNPSRTTVDINGDVWIGNRDEARGGEGSIVKITSSPDAGPTSTGVWNGSSFNRLDWDNTGGADTNGGTDNATDAAIELFVRTPSTNNRTVAIDVNNDVWVGGYGDKEHAKYDGDTGTQIGGSVDVNNGGYGGVIDGNGILWSSNWSASTIGRYDTAAVDPANSYIGSVTTGGRSYGLAVDNDGNIWNSHLDNQISKIDPNTLTYTNYTLTGNGGRGVAVTPDNDIWVANSGSGTLTRLNNDGTVAATISVGNTPTGVSVDSNGKVWVTNYSSNNVVRIDPATNAVDLTVELGSGALPYNYSDMTGSLVGGITNPTGTWLTLLDSGVAGTEWDQIFWNQEAEADIPIGTSIVTEVRTADILGNLAGAGWTAFNQVDNLNLFGQFAQVRTTLTRAGGFGSPTPIFSDLRLTTVPTVPLPASWLLLLTGGAAFFGFGRRRNPA